MPTIRRLLLPACVLALAAAPVLAQTLATSIDLVPVQATPGSPPVSTAPPAASTPAQPRSPEASPPVLPGQSFPSRGGGYQCERTRPTS